MVLLGMHFNDLKGGLIRRWDATACVLERGHQTFIALGVIYLLHKNDVLLQLWERNTLHSVNVNIQELSGWKLRSLRILLCIGIELVEDLIFLSD